MMKISTRLLAAGVLSLTLTAINTGAFAHDHDKGKSAAKPGACCLKPAAKPAPKPAAKPSSANKAAQGAKLACACCVKPQSSQKSAKKN